MNIQQSQLNKGRLDKFLLVINLPKALKAISTGDLSLRSNDLINQDALQFSVYGSVVPEVAVPALTQGYAGQSFKVSSHSRDPYPNVAVNFTIDNNFTNYWVIYKWLDILNNDKESFYDADDIMDTPTVPPMNRNTSKSQTPPADYLADITLYALDEFDSEIIKFEYKKAFPVSLGSIDFNYRTAKEIETTFEFAFAQLLVELIT